MKSSKRKKLGEMLQKLDSKDKDNVIRNHYGFSRLGAKIKQELNLPINNKQAYAILNERLKSDIHRTIDTDEELTKLFQSKQGFVSVRHSDKDLLLESLNNKMNFTPKQVIKLQVGNTYYTIGNNKSRRKIVKALETDFEEIEEQLSSDAKLIFNWNQANELKIKFAEIKGKVSGAFFDKIFNKHVANDFMEISKMCHISHETSYAFIDDDKMKSNIKKFGNVELKIDCMYNDNCLQQSIKTYAKHRELFKNVDYKQHIINYLESLKDFDMVDVKDLKKCEFYNICIKLKNFHLFDDKNHYNLSIHGKGKIIFEIALINKHYIPIIETKMTSYYISNYDDVKLEENAKSIVKLNSKGKYISDKTRYITTDKAIKLLLDKQEKFFIDYHDVYKSNDFISENENDYDDIDLCYDKIQYRNYEIKEHKKPIKIFVADFETHFSNENGYNLTPILCCIKNDSESKCFYEKDSNCSEALLNYVCDKCKDDIVPKIVFHNLKFDAGILLKNVKINPTRVIERGGMLMSMDILYNKRKITFQDSMAYLSMPLKSFSKTFQLDVKKEILPYNYYVEGYNEIISVEEFKNVIKNRYDSEAVKIAKQKASQTHKSISFELEKYKNEVSLEALNIANDWGLCKDNYINMTEYNMKYCEMDCEVLYQGLMKFDKIAKQNIFNIDVDIMMENFKSDLNKYELTNEDKNEMIELRNQELKNFNSQSIFNYKSISSIGDSFMRINDAFDDVVDLCGITRRFISKASCGGRVQTAYNNKIHIKNKILSDFDGVSLYPSAMFRLTKEYGGILKGKPKIIKDLTIEFLNECDGYFVEIKINKVNKKRAFSVLGLRLEDRRLYNDSKLKNCYVVVDKITLEMLIEYNMIEYDIIKGYYFDEGRNPNMGVEVKKLFDLRLKAKSENNEGLSTTYKLMMNSCYGKCGLKASDYTTSYCSKDKFSSIYNNQASSIYSYEYLDNDMVKYKKMNDIDLHYNAIHVSSEILSMSKKIMNEIMYLAEDNNINIYYTDTDSMHIDYNDIDKLSNLYKEKFNDSELHNNGELIGKKLCQFHSDFDSKIISKQSKKDDIVAIESIFLGAKCYIDKITNLENINEDSTLKNKNAIDYHIRAKGVNVDCIVKLAEDYYNGDVMKVYHELLNNKQLTFDLSCGGNKASFKTSDFNVINNHIVRNIKFEGKTYILYDKNDMKIIDTILEDSEEFDMKHHKIENNINLIRRVD